MKTLKIMLASILLVLLFNSCVKIKSDYPDIQFYSVEARADSINADFKIPASILIRQFNISNEYDTDYILVNEGNKVQRYFYHRWINNFDKLATDFIIKSITETRVFVKGVYNTSTYITPDYVLEGYVLEVKNVFDDDNDEYYSIVKIKFNLLQRIEKSTEPVELFNEVFTSKVNIDDDRVRFIPPAIEKAMTDVTNQLLARISESVK